MHNIKLFFIVEGEDPDGAYRNEEIFHNYHEAREHAIKILKEGDTVRAYIGTVMDAYMELANTEQAHWTYDEHLHTFNKLYPVDLLKAYQGHS